MSDVDTLVARCLTEHRERKIQALVDALEDWNAL